MFAFIAGLADIFLICYIYYHVLNYFSGSRTNKVIWGILVLGAITLFAEFLHLNATVWIMQKLWVAGMLAIVIVFQPEIRRGLMTLGTGFSKIGLPNLSNPLDRIWAITSKEYSFIPPMIDAIRTASEERTGMLIVLQQDQGLKDLISDAVIIDAEVSKELLLTIFFDKTMLHDGAVLISNNRLTLAGGVLPLTEQKELSKVLGTRHRAALGMSENSDAIILVVSEESGKVSMARNGMLQVINSLHDLETRLSDLYRARKENSEVRKKISGSHFSIKKMPATGGNEISYDGNADHRGEYKEPSDFKAILKDFFLNPPDLFKVNWQLKLIAFSLSLITYLYVLGGR